MSQNRRPINMNTMIELHGNIQNIRSESMYTRIIGELSYILNSPQVSDEMIDYFNNQIKPLLRHHQHTLLSSPEREPLKNLSEQ